MLRGVGINFRSINTHTAKFDHIHLGGDEQDLGEEGPDRLQEPSPKSADRIVVGTGVAGHISGGNQLEAYFLNFPRGKRARGVTVKQQRPGIRG